MKGLNLMQWTLLVSANAGEEAQQADRLLKHSRADPHLGELSSRRNQENPLGPIEDVSEDNLDLGADDHFPELAAYIVDAKAEGLLSLGAVAGLSQADLLRAVRSTVITAVGFIEYDSDFKTEEKELAKVLKISCKLNNAACKLKLKDYEEAVNLCTKVLEVDSMRVKTYYRRAQAYMQLVELELAEMDIKKALEIDPDNRYCLIMDDKVFTRYLKFCKE